MAFFFGTSLVLALGVFLYSGTGIDIGIGATDIDTSVFLGVSHILVLGTAVLAVPKVIGNPVVYPKAKEPLPLGVIVLVYVVAVFAGENVYPENVLLKNPPVAL